MITQEFYLSGHFGEIARPGSGTGEEVGGKGQIAPSGGISTCSCDS